MKTLICCCLAFLPLKHLHLTSAYGYRVHPITGEYKFHAGIDLRAHSDTVFAILPGKISRGYKEHLGFYVRVSDGKFSITYGHLAKMTRDSSVFAGSSIGITGATGRVTGEHLHLSVTYNGLALNPLKFLYQLIIKQKNYGTKPKTILQIRG